MVAPSDPQERPVWDDDGFTDVQSLFKNPQFIVTAHRDGASQYWYDNMKPRGLFLYDTDTQKNNVFDSGPDIYQRLGPNGDMPVSGPDFSGKFPDFALRQFALWYNQGGRVKQTDPFPSPNVPAQQLTPPPAPAPARPFVVSKDPVWDSGGTEDDIKMAFSNPCWTTERSSAASDWRINMLNFQYDATTNPPTMFDLQIYDHVKGWARNVYMHIASQAMPIQEPFFSDEAIEAFRLWYNGGCPQTPADVGHTTLPTNKIPPAAVDPPFRIRKDINTLTAAELTTYRMQLMNLNTSSIDNSLWQTGGFLHADWCLHYMQASFPWHRAHLLWLETQIGGPIPYWNFFSSKALDPTSADSGIPQAFLDDTFVDTNGKTQPNPLRHALARSGVSRASTQAAPISEVKRAQPFEQPDGTIKRADYITGPQYVQSYLDQVYQATIMTSIGDTQGAGYAFTYAQPDLTPDNLVQYYQDHQHEFDGLLEQAHDNLHGWSGPDMANNSYAAFDPLFWSFHANFDRIFETWIRANPEQDWSSNFPLRPFKGREGNITTIEGDRRLYEYTNIGDMVMDCKALGYIYLPPGNPDYVATTAVTEEVAPIVFFPDVKCTDHTYVLHVGIDNGDGKKLDFNDRGYIGSITRLGMGPNNGNDRCIQNGVLRRLDATKAAAKVGGIPANEEIKLKMLVIENSTGNEVPEAKYKKMPGFKPFVVWVKPITKAKAKP